MVRAGSSLQRLADIREEIHFIEGDLDTPQRAAGTIEKFAPQTVFHLAWQGSDHDARNHSSQIDVNLTGSLLLLAIMLQAGVKCWVGLGSQAEYGPYNRPLTEDLNPVPVNAYGLAKLRVGELAIARCKIAGIRAVWLRLLATYGPDDAAGRLIPYVIRTLLNGESPKLSAGTQRWDYLYVDDAAEAVVAAAFSPSFGVFNLASGSAWTVGELANFLRNEINPAASLDFGTNSPMGLEADISRLVKATGWTPNIPLENGLRKTIDWYRAEHREHAGIATATVRERNPC
jgi:nucleoside-diphosphate-sugar epimerase